MFSCEFCEISENAFSYRTPPLAASETAIWFSDKGIKESEKDLKSTAADRNILQYPAWMQSSRRDHSNDVSDNIDGCLSGLSCRCFFKIMNFSDRFRQCFKPFYSFEKWLFMDFLEFPKRYSRKTVRWSLGLLMLQRDVSKTQSYNCDGAFLRK